MRWCRCTSGVQRALGARDRHALAETVYAVLRRRLWLQHLVQDGRGPLERRLALAGWQGDARTLQAALEPHEDPMARRLGGSTAADAPDKLRHNLPDWLAARCSAARCAEFQRLAAGAARARAAGLAREHAGRPNATTCCASSLHAASRSRPRATAHGVCACLDSPALQDTPAFRAGHFEVQDEGSQLLAALLDAKRGEMVVDFCAGAGGKTLALGASMRNTGRLYAFDTSGHRLDAIKPRIARSGLSNVHTCRSRTSATIASSAWPARSIGCWSTRRVQGWARCAAIPI